MFATNCSRGSAKFLSVLSFMLLATCQTSFAQELAFAANLPFGSGALARVAPKPAPVLPLLERLETLETLTENEAPVEMQALFAEGLPCQLHARSEEGVEITEVHPLFPAHLAATEPVPPSPAAPMLSPTPRPTVQPLMSATAADAPYVAEKISSLQKMVDLMKAKEELMKQRAAYERKLNEFDSKVGKE